MQSTLLLLSRMQVFVRALEGKTLTLKVSEGETVECLKYFLFFQDVGAILQLRKELKPILLKLLIWAIISTAMLP